MGIAKKAAQELLNQNFYNHELKLTILDPKGKIIAANYNISKDNLTHHRIISLIQHVENTEQSLIETSNLDGNITCISSLHQNTILIGYLLIFGPINKVKTSSELILTIVQMYLNSNYKFESNMPLTDRERSDIFVRDLLLNVGTLSPYLIEESKYFHLNITNPLYIAAIYSDKKIKTNHPLYNLRNRINGISLLLKDNFLILVFESSTAFNYIQNFKSPNMQIGISNKQRDFSSAYNEAVETILLLNWLKPNCIDKNDLHYFNEFSNLIPLINCKIDTHGLLENIMNLDINYEQHELLHTFWELMQHNGQIKSTSDCLHIHRNTLTFRLDALSKLLNHNLRNLDQRILVYIALLKYMTFGLDTSLKMANFLLEYNLKH